MAPAGAVDGQRPSKLVTALSRTSSTFLFFSVVVVGVVLLSARWITTTTTLQASLPTTAAIPVAAALHSNTQQPNPSRRSPSGTPRPPPAAYSISCPAPSLRLNISRPAKAGESSQTLALALSSSSSCRSSPDPPPSTASAAAAAAAASSSNASCPSYFRFIHEDLRPWRAAGGVTRAMLARARVTASFRLVVLRGRAFVQRFRPAFQTRDLFTIWGILQLLRRYPGRVPDLDLMFDCVDWPVVRTHLYRGEHAPFMPPLFRYCGDDRTLDIVFPDWSFWGWPEINIKPWDDLQKDLKNGNSRITWSDREPYAYWKGNAAVAESRKELVKCNISSTQDWNARIYTQDWFKESKAGYKNSNLGNQCTHRYKIYVEGSAWSISQKYILACDSMTLLVTPKYYDFFSRSLMPIQHYWPVRDDNKCASIKYAVEWGNSHKQLAQRIGKEASNFIQEEVNMDHVYDYMLHLLAEYAKLLRFKPTKPPEAVEVCSESLVCQAEGIEQKFLTESMVKSAHDSGPCDLPPPFSPLELRMLKQRKEHSVRQRASVERMLSWDALGPRLLLETAPSLQTLHIHIGPLSREEEDEPRGEEILCQQPTMLGHHNLKEFFMVGFEGTGRQVYLVSFVIGVCSTALHHVALYKKGYARDKGHWDWEMVTQQQQSQWTDEEKDKTLIMQIMNGIPSSSTASPVIVFG